MHPREAVAGLLDEEDLLDSRWEVCQADLVVHQAGDEVRRADLQVDHSKLAREARDGPPLEEMDVLEAQQAGRWRQPADVSEVVLPSCPRQLADRRDQTLCAAHAGPLTDVFDLIGDE